MLLSVLDLFTFRVLVAVVALALDWRFADPTRLLGIPHPVIIIGRIISVIEIVLYPDGKTASLNPRRAWLRGILAVALVLLVCVGGVHGAGAWWQWVSPTIAGILGTSGVDAVLLPKLLILPMVVLELVLVFWLLAAKGLHDHATLVAETENIHRARAGLRALAGRKSDGLNRAAVLRTAGESLAENYSDAVIAPLCWYLLLGPGGIVGYKAINSMDSMWGYRNAKYRQFGWAAARLDDVANMVPARLSALLLWLSALVSPDADAASGWRCLKRDARHHPSPNAGYPEAMMAGALGLRFGGPRQYPGGVIETTWLGDGKEDWQRGDLQRCLRLYRLAVLLFAATIIDMLITVRVLDWWVWS